MDEQYWKNIPQAILVLVTDLLEHTGSNLGCCRILAVLSIEHIQLVGNDICNRLGVGGRARAAAPDCVVNLGKLVGDAVGDIGTGGGSRISALRRISI